MFFLLTTDKYSAVFTEYSVAKNSAGHYSAYTIVGLSLPVSNTRAERDSDQAGKNSFPRNSRRVRNTVIPTKMHFLE
jgi:hypothetical protein